LFWESAKAGKLYFMYLGERGRLLQLSAQETFVRPQLSVQTPAAEYAGWRKFVLNSDLNKELILGEIPFN